MSRIDPVIFVWREVEVADDEDGVIRVVKAMVPEPRFARLADRQYALGAAYRLAPDEGQSKASRGHFFASVHEAFQNLPEGMQPAFPTEEHLRKWALIEVGYFDEKQFEFASPEAAQSFALYCRTEQPFARILVRGCMVIVRKAKSQSPKAMGGKSFQESKQAVLDCLATMIGVNARDLRKEGTKTNV